MGDFPPLDLSKVRTIPLKDRPTKVGVADLAKPFEVGSSFKQFIDSIPHQWGGVEFRDAIEAIAQASANKRPIIWGMGAHVIKNGLSPLIIQLIESGVVSALVFNGAGLIHDFELSFAGSTSEDVSDRLGQGDFGMGRETAEFLNRSVTEGDKENLGFGASAQHAIKNIKLPHQNISLIRYSALRKIPLFVVVAIGTDTIHFHPSIDPGALGRALHRDVLGLSGVVADMEGGVFLNIGSAVLIPEVFLKALTLSRNLGHQVEKITTINFDFIKQYRPEENVVRRPTLKRGRGISFIGQHELLIPMFAAALMERVAQK
ncbi:MAG TPA: hypothetical protein VJL87_02410 [Bdellovibrionota bacterium]|nr:hypothetical protein [Bdellovibrionota bacterium]